MRTTDIALRVSLNVELQQPILQQPILAPVRRVGWRGWELKRAREILELSLASTHLEQPTQEMEATDSDGGTKFGRRPDFVLRLRRCCDCCARQDTTFVYLDVSHEV
jgi:hypothetical protein